MKKQIEMPEITLDQFRQWLFKQPVERQFDYMDCQDCMWSSFMYECHGIKVGTGGFSFNLKENWDQEYPLPEWFTHMMKKEFRPSQHFTAGETQKTYTTLHF